MAKIQMFYKFDKIENIDNGDKWRISKETLGETATIISSEDAARVYYKLFARSICIPSSFFFVVESDSKTSEIRYTIVSSIDMLPSAAWLTNRCSYNEIMNIIDKTDYNGKYKVLVGSDDESRLNKMIKMVEFLGFAPVVIHGNGNYDPIVCRERLHHLLTDADLVFYPKKTNESYTNWFGTECRICEFLGIPYYNMDEMEALIVKKALEEDVKINVTKNNDKSIFIDDGANCGAFWGSRI